MDLDEKKKERSIIVQMLAEVSTMAFVL